MTRLNRYLLTEINNEKRIVGKTHRSVPISENEFLKLKETKCKQAVNSPMQIYRGISDSNEKYLYINPSEHTRVSQYTSNWYMLLMEIAPQWKKYPLFSKSVICTTSSSFSGSWGTKYIVYPYDNAVLGVCPEKHFWESIQNNTGYTMAGLSNFMKSIFKLFKIKISDNETDVEVLKKKFQIIDKISSDERFNILDNKDFYRHFRPYLSEIIEGKRDLLDIFVDMIPAKGFKLAKIGDDLPNNVEVWTNSPCILELVEQGGSEEW